MFGEAGCDVGQRQRSNPRWIELCKIQQALLSLKDLALSRPVCTFFEAYWQDKFSKNELPLRVGNDVATINDVMGVIEILSSLFDF